MDFSNKRNDAKKSSIYKRRIEPERWIDAKKMLHDKCEENNGHIPEECVKGKFLKKDKWLYEEEVGI